MIDYERSTVFSELTKLQSEVFQSLFDRFEFDDFTTKQALEVIESKYNTATRLDRLKEALVMARSPIRLKKERNREGVIPSARICVWQFYKKL